MFDPMTGINDDIANMYPDNRVPMPTDPNIDPATGMPRLTTRSPNTGATGGGAAVPNPAINPSVGAPATGPVYRPTVPQLDTSNRNNPDYMPGGKYYNGGINPPSPGGYKPGDIVGPPPPGGYTPGGIVGPGTSASTFNYEKARDTWMQHGSFGSADEARAAAAKWAAANGVPYNGGDTITLPNGGGSIDIASNFAGGRGNGQRIGATWTPAGGNGPNPGGSSAGGGGGAGGAGGGSFGFSSSGSQFGSQDPAIHAAIMRLLARGEKPVGEQDIASQYGPASHALERGAQRTRMAAAERAAAGGGNQGGAGGGAFDANVNAINEGLGQQQGELAANLTGRELMARRGDVANALQFAQGEERTALQLQLSQIDSQLRREQMGQQNQQFYDTMGYNMGRDEMLYNQIQAGLGGDQEG